MHLLITGEVGVGKTTLISNLLEDVPKDRIYGFYTQKISPDGKFGKAGEIYMFPAPYGLEPKLEHCVAKILGHRQFDLHIEEFETYGVSLLSNIPEGSFVLMDELGFLESNAPKFCNKVMEVLDCKVCVIGVVKPKHTAFLDRVRQHKNVRLFEITVENREEQTRQIRQILKEG